jgi:hypothetical protein
MIGNKSIEIAAKSKCMGTVPTDKYYGLEKIKTKLTSGNIYYR